MLTYMSQGFGISCSKWARPMPGRREGLLRQPFQLYVNQLGANGGSTVPGEGVSLLFVDHTTEYGARYRIGA